MAGNHGGWSRGLRCLARTHEIVVAAELSAHEGRPVKLPLPR